MHSTHKQAARHDLLDLIELLTHASHPADVFGDPAHWRRTYKTLVKRIHPDRFARNPDLHTLAQTATSMLNEWADIADKTFATSPSPHPHTSATFDAGRHRWVITDKLAVGDIADLFHARDEAPAADPGPVVLKIVRDRANNDLLDAESRALRRLFAQTPDDLATFAPYLPAPRHAFTLPDGRRANVLSLAEGYFSLADVRAAYPDGVDEPTLAWMFNRVLEVLAWCHDLGVVHGAVLPEHVLVHPRTHGAVLVGWGQSALDGAPLRTISTPYRRWYPAEVFDRAPSAPSLDLALAARTMLAVGGGNPRFDHLPERLSPALGDVLRGCLLPDPDQRFQDAFTVYERFQQALRRVHGPPRYHPFRMPPSPRH